MPVAPEGMNEESLQGLELFLGYWREAVNYGIRTGDFSLVAPIIAPSHTVDVEYFSWPENLYDHGGWAEGGTRIVELHESGPRARENGVYRWEGKLIVDDSTFHYKGESTPTDNSPTQDLVIDYEVVWMGEDWELANIHKVAG